MPDLSSRRTALDDKMKGAWPTNGAITFTGAKMRYRPGLPLVLKGLDLNSLESHRLFSGTDRSNLDPFDEYDDEALFVEILERVGSVFTPQKYYLTGFLIL